MKDGERETSQVNNWLTEAGFTLQLRQYRLRKCRYNVCPRNVV